MPTVGLTRPRTGLTPLRPGAHPKAVIRSDSGLELILPYAPQGVTLAGRGAVFSQLPRPGRRPLVLREGDGAATAALDLTLGAPDRQANMQPVVRALQKLADQGERITIVDLSPAERGPWRIESLSIVGTARQHGTNNITRADVTLNLIEAVDVRNLGPLTGGKNKPKKLRHPTHYTTKKGDTLRSIADQFYGAPAEWKRIAKANKIKDPRKLKTGRRLLIPANAKPKAGK